MTQGSGLSRGGKRRNERVGRLRAAVPVGNAILGIDLAEEKEALVFCDHDLRVLVRRRVGPRLANTARLAPYATAGGRVTAEDVKRARRHKYAGKPLPPTPTTEPMRFKPRRKTNLS